ncbi:hypothetical protein FZEAL_510 [Fusarium zealandicum]|uniref:Uncharacterized protein n=1 Tax=Fusarium zealandicum TaxID=1053134 RepID=A0A8H4XQE1_9HYPO|nr:hypothetical protein FZEAL_510 [Fusarium zealandicum]
MTLTPIRIRGKRKTPYTSKPPSALRSDTQNASTHDTRHPKKMKRSLSNVLASRSSRWRPSLQALPFEVLESIFLYSANIALPRSAPVIGAKLSGRATLIRLLIWAFHDTWNQWFGIALPARTLAEPKSKIFDGDPVFQSAVLELPWVNIDLILQAQQTWADAYARDRYYEHCLPHSGPGPRPTRHGHDFEGGFGHFNARQCFDADFQEALSWEPFSVLPNYWRTHDVHRDVRIPTQLVSGPWDDEKLRRLFWLVRGGAVELQDDDLPPWEVRLETLLNAYIDAPVPSALISNCFDSSWLCTDMPTDVAREQCRRLDRRLEWGADDATGKAILRQIKMFLGGMIFYEG